MPQNAVQYSGNFDAATSLNQTPLESKTRVSGGTSTWQLPRVGYLSYIDIPISMAITGTVGTVNAAGFAAAIKRVTLSVNNIGYIYDTSGVGYHFAVRHYLNDYRDPVKASNARAAITATTGRLDMRIPVSLNDRDPLGLLLLQNEQTLATLTIQWETDANLTSTGSVGTVTVQPSIYWFTVPENPADRPPINYIHQVLEDSVAISGAGVYNYDVPRGGILTHLTLGAGWAASGSDNWSEAILKLQSAYQKWDLTTVLADINFDATHNYSGVALPASQRLAGTIPFDFVGTSGLGTYGKLRDAIDSRALTYLRAAVTMSGSGTLYAIRRQLSQLAAQ